MNSKKRIYDRISLGLSVAFVVLCAILLGGILFAQHLLVSSINDVYTPIKSSYDESQTLVKTTVAAIPGYKEDVAKLMKSTDFFGSVGVDNKLKADVINTIDSLQNNVSSGQEQTANMLQVIEGLNGLIGYVNEGANTNLPTVAPNAVNNLSSVLSEASTSLVELKTLATSANPSAANAKLAEDLTNTVNGSLDTANAALTEVNGVVKVQFAKLTALKKSIIWWIRLSTILIAILFAWAIYTGVELSREKYKNIRHKKS